MGLFSKVKDLANSISPVAHATGGDLGSIIPGIGDSMAAEKQNAANVKGAQDAMAFSERMSSTAYQRAMDDMKKAGLNPTLAFQQGGASAPSGVAPSIASETKTGLGSAAISTALGVKGLQNQQQQVDTQQATAHSAIQLNQSTAAKQVQEIAESQARTNKTKSETRHIDRYGPRDEAQAKLEGKAARLADSLLEKIGTTASEIKSSKRSMFDRLKDSMFRDYEVKSPKKSAPTKNYFSGGKQ